MISFLGGIRFLIRNIRLRALLVSAARSVLFRENESFSITNLACLSGACVDGFDSWKYAQKTRDTATLRRDSEYLWDSGLDNKIYGILFVVPLIIHKFVKRKFFGIG